MLDLNHPMTPHRFRASGLIDGLMSAGHEMTVASSTVRAELLGRCLPPLKELRELNHQHFGGKDSTDRAIDEYEAGIRRLASFGNGQIAEDRRDGEGDCPHCGTKITKVRALPGIKGYEDHFLILCMKCSECYMPAKEKLAWEFGTWAI